LKKSSKYLIYLDVTPALPRAPLIDVELGTGMKLGLVPRYNLTPGKEAELLAAIDKRQLDWQRGMVENPNNYLYT